MGGDPECDLLKYYANVEADQFRNMENARRIWTDILQVHQFKVDIKYHQLIRLYKIKLKCTYLLDLTMVDIHNHLPACTIVPVVLQPLGMLEKQKC